MVGSISHLRVQFLDTDGASINWAQSTTSLNIMLRLLQWGVGHCHPAQDSVSPDFGAKFCIKMTLLASVFLQHVCSLAPPAWKSKFATRGRHCLFSTLVDFISLGAKVTLHWWIRNVCKSKQPVYLVNCCLAWKTKSFTKYPGALN